MPLFYSDVPGATQTTNAAANTPNDCFFIKPGTRTVWLKGVFPEGRGATLTSISGISYRIEKWFTTAASGGSAIVPSPNDDGYQAAKHTAGFSAAAVVSGTGGPTLMASFGSGTTSPGNWIAPTLDEAYSLEGGVNKSLDVFNVSGATSLVFEMFTSTVE
jgi:hypothetical protein